MRLVAQAKMGYYPTPEDVTPIIANYLKRQREGLIRILDPCAGMGTAVRYMGDILQAETYGVEIDLERGNQAKERLTWCLVTDYQNTRISHGAFSLLWLNPAYDWAIRDSEIETSERYERTFLRDCVCYLRSKGILVYLIPQRRLDGQIARMLSYRFEQISVYRFPEKAYKAYRQLVIFGVLKNRPEKDDTKAEYLKNCGNQSISLPYLPMDPPMIYEVPLSLVRADFVFRSKDIDPQELEEEIRRHGLFDQVRDMTTPLRMAEKIRPIMPLRHGHLAQILACGLMNGIVWDKEKKNPLLIKGITKKEVKHAVEVEGNCEKHIETDLIKITIHAFNRRGELLTIE
jgi:tRNA1(Val) A37 N6-methylase TrmN6